MKQITVEGTEYMVRKLQTRRGYLVKPSKKDGEFTVFKLRKIKERVTM